MAPKKATTTAKEEEEKKVVEDPKKRKAEGDEAAPKKEAKKDETTKAKKEDEDAKGEKEKNSPADKRAQLKETVTFNPEDTTLNVVPSAGGKMLMALTEGGMQYLIAGARANVGVKSGRYMYEVKIVEALNPSESAGGQRGRVPMPRQLVRLGFSAGGTSPLLGESDAAAYFDSEGFYVSAKGKKVAAAQRFTRDQVISVVLNVDSKSPNANTMSLFREGERISEPQPLPEQLIGKPLFPHIAFRSVTVQMLFGPAPTKALSFDCRMIQAAAQADVVVSPGPEPGSKFEVVLPVGLPDEGTFDHLDDFLEKNPHFVELSDRKIQEWAASSGLVKPRIAGPSTSNDKPQFNYGLPGMDDGSIRRIVCAMAPVVPRHYVIMEVKSNLVAAERQEILKRFNLPHFKKVASVVMGEPSEEYKHGQLEKRLQEKQAKADAEWKQKKAEEERKRQVEQRQKQLAEMRRKADEARKKAAEEARKKREEELKKREAEKKAKEEAENKEDKEGEEASATKEEEVKAEEGMAMEVEEAKDEKKEEEDQAKEEAKEEEEKKDEEEEKAEEGPPQVELTEEEQKMCFRQIPAGSNGDVTTAVMSQAFGSFTIPGEDEGFDEVRFEWQDAESSKEYLSKWVKERKITSRIEDLQPGQWFADKSAEWTKTLLEWQKKHKEYSTSAAKKAKDEAKKKREEKDDGDENGKDAEMEADIYAADDVCNIGDGEPLFAHFAFEDWALLQLRVELYFLTVAFMKDADDPERLGVHEQHLSFYYNRYFRKTLNPKYFGMSTNDELCKIVKDTVALSEDTHILTSQLAEETESVDIFVKLTEEQRRERQRRIDAGDETAKLKFTAMAMQQPQAIKAPVAGTGAAARPAGGWPAGARPAGMTSWGTGFRPGTTPARWPVTGQQPTYAPRAPTWGGRK